MGSALCLYIGGQSIVGAFFCELLWYYDMFNVLQGSDGSPGDDGPPGDVGPPVS